MFTTATRTTTTRTALVTAIAVGVAALAGELLFLDRQVAQPFAAAVASTQRPQLVEEITVVAPAPATHYVNVPTRR